MADDSGALRDEALRINYRLRSTFFYRKLKEYNTLALPLAVAALFPVETLYLWDERGAWGISVDSFAYVQQHPALHLIQVFCHPKVVVEHPTLLAYYRHIAALSLKGVQQMVGIDVSKFERQRDKSAKARPLTQEQVLTIVRLYNEHISLIVDSSLQNLTSEELGGLLLASTGTQIDGSWRNAIGQEAERVLQRLLIREAIARSILAAFLPRAGVGVDVFDETQLDERLKHIERYRGIMLTNHSSLLFASDPDIAVIDSEGATICAVEVKGGADPAGALERYGAAKKSFDAARRQNPTVRTMLVASCITEETLARIAQDPAISTYFNLTELLSEAATYDAFMTAIFGSLP